MEIKSKSWLESITSIGGILAVVAGLLGYLGFQLPPDAVTTATDLVNQGLAAWSSKDWVGLMSAVTAAIAAGLTFLGRYQGDQRVHFITPYTYEIPSTIVANAKGVNPPLTPAPTPLTAALRAAPSIPATPPAPATAKPSGT